MRILTTAVCVAVLATTACSKREAPAASTGGPAAAPAQVPVAQLPKVDPAKILDHIKVLSADDMEGRAPGTAGEEKAVAYIEGQFKQLGLQPGNPDGTYVQKVPLVGITGSQAQPLTFSRGASKLQLKWKDDVVAWSKHVAASASVANSDVVFAGYGVE